MPEASDIEGAGGDEFFAACLPGIEPLLHTELGELGISTAQERGGVSWRGGPGDVALVHRASALASHVLLRVATFRAGDFAVLRSRCERLPWSQWLAPGSEVALDAATHKSRLYHTGAIADRVARALESAVPNLRVVRRRVREVAAEAAPPAVLVRIVRDLATVSIDLTGTPLHRRGYRVETAKAPLREDLAAALLRVSGWRPGVPLVDPFAGSGTIVLEAARAAAGLLPGAGRRFAAQSVRGFDTPADEAPEGIPAKAPPCDGPILASDRDAGAVDAMWANAERAGVAALVQGEAAPLSAAPGWSVLAERGGIVVTNPPFGRRVGRSADLRPVYQRLGRLVAESPHGVRLAMIVSDPPPRPDDGTRAEDRVPHAPRRSASSRPRRRRTGRDRRARRTGREVAVKRATSVHATARD